jgi:hypothetical protein
VEHALATVPNESGTKPQDRTERDKEHVEVTHWVILLTPAVPLFAAFDATIPPYPVSRNAQCGAGSATEGS